MTASGDRGQHPVLEDLQHLGADAGVGELARERRIVKQPATARARLIRGHGRDLFGHHLQRRRGCATASFELQQILRDGPAVVDLAEHIRLRHANLVEEHLVLDLLARRHHQRADLDARRRHVDQHERDALLLLLRLATCAPARTSSSLRRRASSRSCCRCTPGRRPSSTAAIDSAARSEPASGSE